MNRLRMQLCFTYNNLITIVTSDSFPLAVHSATDKLLTVLLWRGSYLYHLINFALL